MFVSNEYIQELKTYLKQYSANDIDDLFGFKYNSRSVYSKLFEPPVERIFYAFDKFYSGDLMVIFEYKNIYIVAYGNFGSCCICDIWESITSLSEVKSGLEEIFARLEYVYSLHDIELYNCYSEDIRQRFYDFKLMNSDN